jgi:uncharacterized paraquat-inducible protein A
MLWHLLLLLAKKPEDRAVRPSLRWIMAAIFLAIGLSGWLIDPAADPELPSGLIWALRLLCPLLAFAVVRDVLKSMRVQRSVERRNAMYCTRCGAIKTRHADGSMCFRCGPEPRRELM